MDPHRLLLAPSHHYGNKLTKLNILCLSGEDVEKSMYVSKFQKFLDQYEDKVGVLLIEPQWGLSQAAFQWPDNLLKTYIAMAKAGGIRIVCNEIMCRLGVGMVRVPCSYAKLSILTPM